MDCDQSSHEAAPRHEAETLTEALTEAQEARLHELAEKAKKLLDKDKRINNACSVLITAQRVYDLAVGEIFSRLAEAEEDEAVGTTLQEAMAACAGEKGYERTDVLLATTEIVLPFLQALIEDESLAEVVAERKQREQEAAARVRMPVPVGFRLEESWEEPAIDRDRILLLSGDPVAVDWLITHMVDAARGTSMADGSKACVMRLLAETRNHAERRDENRRYIEVGVNRWGDCGRSEKQIDKALQSWQKMLKNGRLDLLVIDDLAAAYEMPSVYTAAAKAANCHRKFRKWADQQGCAVVAGLPADYGEGAASAWNELDVYTNHYVVRIEEQPGEPESSSIYVMRPQEPEVKIYLAEAIPTQLLVPQPLVGATT